MYTMPSPPLPPPAMPAWRRSMRLPRWARFVTSSAAWSGGPKCRGSLFMTTSPIIPPPSPPPWPACGAEWAMPASSRCSSRAPIPCGSACSATNWRRASPPPMQSSYLRLPTPAQVVIGMETDLKLPGRPAEIQEALAARYRAQPGQLEVFGCEQWTAPVASGSNAPRAMVVCPCTSGTLSAIAHGSSDDLLERAADVVMKERRQLILVVREMPLSVIHLEIMLKLARMGVTIMPAAPGFYHEPRRIEDLVDFVVARIMDHLDIPQDLIPPWG